MGFRPESLEIVGAGKAFLSRSVVEELGSDAVAYGTIEAAEYSRYVAKETITGVDLRLPPRKGERIELRVRDG